MAFVTVKEAARLTGKATQTIYRHISEGKLSKADSGIDTAELVRVYGALKSVEELNTVSKSVTKITHVLPHENEVGWFKNRIERLENDLKDLKNESREREQQFIEREKRLLALIENKMGVVSSDVPRKSWLDRLLDK